MSASSLITTKEIDALRALIASGQATKDDLDSLIDGVGDRIKDNINTWYTERRILLDLKIAELELRIINELNTLVAVIDGDLTEHINSGRFTTHGSELLTDIFKDDVGHKVGYKLLVKVAGGDFHIPQSNKAKGWPPS